MKIAKDKVVGIDYTLRDVKGEVLDRSEEGSPLLYLHGNGNLVAGLERALEGRIAGDAFRVQVAPVDGYGERDDALHMSVGRDRFEPGAELREGMRFRAGTPDGSAVFTVVGFEGNDVLLDGNHPLAGETLDFDVKVVEVREATSEEIAHGHVHAPGGHHHH